MSLDIVTGSFGYIGRAITRQLLDSGRQVRTVTAHPGKPSPFGDRVDAHLFNFDKPERLVASLQGAETLYNTYWIRFPYGGATFEGAVQNTKILFDCARRAGVRKIVHISVTQASESSPLPYYRGKAQQEQALIETGVEYAIVRPTLVFGQGDILVNNMAWLLRRFPLFPIFGSREYTLQPVHVDDVAALAIASTAAGGRQVLDAAGPETFTFEAFIRLMASALGSPSMLVHLPPGLGITLGRLIGLFIGDVILTRDELEGLMASLLVSSDPPLGKTLFSEWLRRQADNLGKEYASELRRHFRWKP